MTFAMADPRGTVPGKEGRGRKTEGVSYRPLSILSSAKFEKPQWKSSFRKLPSTAHVEVLRKKEKVDEGFLLLTRSLLIHLPQESRKRGGGGKREEKKKLGGTAPCGQS